MPRSAASAILHAFLLTLLLGATGSVPAGDGGDGDVNPSKMFTNGTVPSPPKGDDTERYICYLCTGRNPLLLRYCPIYWDECHLVCYGEDASAAIPAAPAPVPASLVSSSSAAAANPGEVNGHDCYVMKLYRNGTYTIVTRLSCDRIATCVLSCGGGDMADSADRNFLTTAAAPAPTTAAVQGSLTPRLADFERCGTQVTATPSSLRRGAVVRAGGGARRRR